MSNEPENKKPVATTPERPDTDPENARSLLPHEYEDARAAEMRLDAIYTEGMRPSRPNG